MSQCVPNWDLDDTSVPTRFNLRRHHHQPPSSSTSNSSAPDIPMLDYEIAELTWENGQLSMHGLGLPRVSSKHSLSTSPNRKYAWERPRAATGTLESIVNLATQKPPAGNAQIADGDDVDLVPWLDRRSHHHQSSDGVSGGAKAPATVTMDALVPSETTNKEEQQGEGVHVPPRSQGIGTCVVGGSAHVDPFGGGVGVGKVGKVGEVEEGPSVLKKASSAPRVPVAGEWSREQSGSVSVSRSGTFGGDSKQVPCERELGGIGLSSTSFCSQGNTFSSSGRPATNNTTTVDDHDSVCHSRPQKETGNKEDRKKETSKSSLSTKRSRAAAVHNQSERKRRDKINQKMKMLQKLVPNSSKTDKASMLDEVIDYLKQLQAQVQMMSRMSMPSMMMPLAMQQQLQMSMMNPMGMGAAMGLGAMGMGMGMGMDMNMNINPMARQNLAGISPAVINPTAAAFMPMAAAWDVGGDCRLPSQAAVVPTDPISTYLACQSQPMTMEAYSRMVALIQQQQQQQQANSSKN